MGTLPNSRDVVRLQTDLLTVGRFEARPHDCDFETAGVITTPVFVFPRVSVWIQHDGDDAFVADANWITCYNASQPYRRRKISLEGDVSDWFRVRPDALLEVVQSVDRSVDNAEAPFRSSRLRADPETCLIERRLFRDLPSFEPFVAEEMTLALLERVLQHAFGQTGVEDMLRTTVAQRECVELAKGVLGRMFEARLALSDVSREVGCSHFHLCRIFKAHTGLTLHQYREQLRIAQAVTRLLESDSEVTEIALSVGYSTHSHFTWAFRRVFNMTPSAVRASGAGLRHYANALEAFFQDRARRLPPRQPLM
jgi:AraC family transcriptional regulator